MSHDWLELLLVLLIFELHIFALPLNIVVEQLLNGLGCHVGGTGSFLCRKSVRSFSYLITRIT